ncbi:hypothetical protein LINPERPRIM_LOCUS35140 [Linum perenne]
MGILIGGVHIFGFWPRTGETEKNKKGLIPNSRDSRT